MPSKASSITDRIVKAGKHVGRYPEVVPEWDNETVYLHEMSTRDAQDFFGLAQEMEEGGEQAVGRNLTATVDLLMRCVRDEGGVHIFTTDEHREFLLDQPLRLVSRLAKKLMDASAVTEGTEGNA
jgi:hypothetical protein